MTARPCPNAAAHTPYPTSYIGHSAWAEQMLLTHDQRQCPACDLSVIWRRKPGGSWTAPAIADNRCSRCGTYYPEGALIRTDGNGGWIASACCPRRAVSASPDVLASGHPDSRDRPPATATAPPAHDPAITHDHRNETT